MKIALGAARGLAYLHEDSNPCVIHRDFKTSIVLLEDDFTPKMTSPPRFQILGWPGEQLKEVVIFLLGSCELLGNHTILKS